MAEFSRTSITVNGQTYNSVDEMPPDVRRRYEQVMSMMADKNNNGVPDIMEGDGGGMSTGDGKDTVVTRTVVRDIRFEPTRGTGRVESREVDPSLLDYGHTRQLSTRDGMVYMTWPTLLGLLATMAVVGAAGVYFFVR